MDLKHTPKNETIALLLGMVVVGLFIVLLLLFKQQQVKAHKITQLNTHLQEIFDAEVADAMVHCNSTADAVAVKYFPQYEIDCDDLTVISDPDPEVEGM